MAICDECNALITEFDNLLKKARKLDRLFTGMQEETSLDLTLQRLNTYRDHFSLTRIPEVKKEQTHFDYLEQDSESEAEVIEEPQIIEEFYEDEEIIENVANEIYLEDNLELDESMQSEETIYSSEDVGDLYQKSHGRAEKTEDEKLFNFKCQICVEEFINMRLLTQHCKSVHNTIPLVKCCSESCGKTLSTWRRLIIHKEKHFPNENSAKLRCEICKR